LSAERPLPAGDELMNQWEKPMSVNLTLAVCAVVLAIMAPDAAFAYIGPGAGLGMIGSLVAVLGAVLLAVVGLLVLPFRMLARRRKAASAQKAAAPVGLAQHR
jgi:hypothetical protein